ncbi:MAG TPA: DNA repair protein RadC [Burkholderiales bacterium]|jgi:DNA repair protein RadC|nr:DNA repair protein RadC [Burkholderiales bacterium]
MPITDWPEGERPREKLIAKGAESLSDSELLAIFLRTGIKGKSAVDVARELMSHFGSLSALLAAPQAALCTMPGMGDAKYVQLRASVELAKRALREEMAGGVNLNSPQSVRDYLKLTLKNLPHEVFVGVFLDARNRVIEVEELFRGTLMQTSVFPREIVKRALHFNAAAVIFAHNHPSGVAEPSGADQTLTEALKRALGLIDVRVLDHFIIAGGSAMSFAERGLL